MQKLTLKEFFIGFYSRYPYRTDRDRSRSVKSCGCVPLCPAPMSKKERKFATIITYFLFLTSFVCFFMPLKNNFLAFVIWTSVLIMNMEWGIQFNVFKILILYLLYRKNFSPLTALVADISLLEKNGLKFLSNFRGIIKYNHLDYNIFSYTSFSVEGKYKKKHIIIKFKYRCIIIVFDGKKYNF